MKTITIALTVAFAAFPLSVLAQSGRGDYQAAERKVALCRMIGEDGERAFLAKQAEQPKPQATIGSYIDPLKIYSVNYGYDVAVDRKDAYMKGWAYCMDNLDRLARNAR